MEIYLDKHAVKQIRLSTADAIEEGDIEALKEDIESAFPEECIEALEDLLGGAEFMDLLGEILNAWSGDDVDELFDLLETQLGDHRIDLKYYSADEEDFDDGDDFALGDQEDDETLDA